MEKGIIDRFEGELAVVEIGKEMRYIPRTELPKNSEVGDLLVFNGNSVTIDKAGTEKLRAEIKELMDELFEEE